MKFLADCKTNPVAIMANPSTPIHIAVKPGPIRASTELDIPSTAFSAMAAPVLGGNLLDQQGHGLTLWCAVAVISLAVLPFVKGLRPRFQPDFQERSNTVSILKQGVQAVSGSNERPFSSNNR